MIIKSKEPVARFLKSYAVFVFDHTGKEDVFFKMIQEKHSISDEEDIQLVKHYELCKNQTVGQARIEEMISQTCRIFRRSRMDELNLNIQ
jgi:hypothetical protein